MKIERDSMIGGQPIKMVRDMLVDIGRSDAFYIGAIEDHLQKEWWRSTIDEMIAQGKLPREHRGLFRRDWTWPARNRKIYGVQFKKMPNFTEPLQALVEALLKDGLIEEVRRDTEGDTLYRCTKKGQALRMTTFAPRMNRAKAETVLKGVLERAAEINVRADLLYWITEIRVFGSYLTDTDDLGDLDLAVKIDRRPIRDCDYVKVHMEFAEKHGKAHANYLEELNFAEVYVRRAIRHRSPYISLHGVDELDRNPEMGGKTIYAFTPPVETQD